MLEITQSTRRPFGMNDSWLKCYDKRKERRTIVGPYIGSIIEYHVPSKAVKSGKLILNWGDPEITEVWLIKK